MSLSYNELTWSQQPPISIVPNLHSQLLQVHEQCIHLHHANVDKFIHPLCPHICNI